MPISYERSSTLTQIISAILFSISSNIDNIAFGISYGIKKINISFFNIIILSFITSFITLASMWLGNILSFILPDCIGAFFLIVVGIFTLFTTFTKKNNIENSSTSINMNKKQLLLLSFMLSSNNIGTGIAASIMGINITITILFTIVFFTLFLYIGNNLGKRLYNKSCTTKKYDIMSSIILIMLGIIELIIK